MSNPPVPSVGTILQNRAVSPVLFALCGLFFFFTFCEISCGSQKIASMTGVDLVKGSTIDLGKGMESMAKDMAKNLKKDLGSADATDETDEAAETIERDLESAESDKKPSSGKEVEPNPFAILALIAAAAGILSYFLGGNARSMLAIGCGALGAITLLVMQITMNAALKKEGNEMMPIELNFKFAYWGALFGFVLAALIAWWQRSTAHQVNQEEVYTAPPIDFD